MEHKVYEEMYHELVDFGGIDSGNKVFRVLTNVLELKVGESGKDGGALAEVGPFGRGEIEGGSESNVSRLGNVAKKKVVINSGEMYPVIGISQRESSDK